MLALEPGMIPHYCDKIFIYSKSMNNRFWNRKGTKTINNRNIIDLNRKGRLKHRIEIFFDRST